MEQNIQNLSDESFKAMYNDSRTSQKAEQMFPNSGSGKQTVFDPDLETMNQMCIDKHYKLASHGLFDKSIKEE